MNWAARKKMYVMPWKDIDAFRTFARLADQPYSLFFDSAREGHPLSQYSYICWHPLETIECKDGRVTITNRENQFTYTADPFIVIRERLALWGEQRGHDKKLPPFQGGAAGFFGYDLARDLELLPDLQDSDELPDMCVGLYDKVIAFDHVKGTAHFIIHAEDEKEAQAHLTHVEMLMDHVPPYRPTKMDWQSERSDTEFASDIARTIEYIHAGDIFQANLSRRFTAPLPHGFNPLSHYGALRKGNSAPCAAYLNFGGFHMLSASPERFLNVTGRKIETRPIKGTLSTDQAPEVLENSAKDRAENVMIVDLMRNDLSKVCEDHSVTVTKLCDIETFEGLHHMVSIITGTLQADQTAMDALRACFPGGSITGAPKIRAMEIIEELEPNRRGPYCGAIGWIGYNGDMDTAITIRTLVFTRDEVRLQTGAGIVADSIPEQEVTETLTKARKLFESFTPAATIAVA
jgi:para-aminobenzoate synthetase component 1